MQSATVTAWAGDRTDRPADRADPNESVELDLPSRSGEHHFAGLPVVCSQVMPFRSRSRSVAKAAWDQRGKSAGLIARIDRTGWRTTRVDGIGACEGSVRPAARCRGSRPRLVRTGCDRARANGPGASLWSVVALIFWARAARPRGTFSMISATADRTQLRTESLPSYTAPVCSCSQSCSQAEPQRDRGSSP